MKNKVLFSLLCFFLYAHVFAQKISPEIINKQWKARWIASERKMQRDYGVYHFRKKINLTERPSSFIVHVSADNRYKLFVNGSLVSLGPARADVTHWNFETVDIAPYLKANENVIAAVVWNFGEFRTEAEISYRTAFILQGDTEKESVVNTDNTWKCTANKSYSPLKPELVYTYYVAGPAEKIEYNNYPTGWESLNYDDTGWQQAVTLQQGLPRGAYVWENGWLLVPRTIPHLELKEQRLQSARQATGIELPKNFPAAKASFTIPANKKITVLLDQGELTNAFPVLSFDKGKEATIVIGYAEALYINKGTADWKGEHEKGNRNQVAGKRFVGVKDNLLADGKSHTFSSLSWRTYRYLQLEIETKEEPLTIEDIYGIFVGYPFELKAKFNAGNKELDKILEVGWYTARLDAIETYMDCPYYEQLQYLGDGRIQAMVSLYNSGDDRLMRNMITQADYSRIPEGLTQSRYPSNTAQFIPTFSLWWIAILHDYWWYRNDTAFVKSFLPGTRQVLNYFSQFQQADGSLLNPPYWMFTDWVRGKGWSNGVPPKGTDGNSAVLDLQLVLAYQTAADMEDNLGMKAFATLYRNEAAKLIKTIRAKYWDSGTNLFSDTKEKNLFSEHVNTLAILANLVIGKDATGIAEKMLADTSITEATIYFKYYVNQALNKAGLGNLYLNQLDTWKQNLAMGLTTWAEISDINNSRSDCHAWASSPNIEFYRIVLGINSSAPGFSKIKIEPHLGELKNASGSIPHPNGEISVSYKISTNGKREAIISIPSKTEGHFIWKEKSYSLKAGVNKFSNL
jgi:alpha-L-rhamnosidase